MAHDVFISYSSKDKSIADAVCANLEAIGIRCWIAPRDIAAGEDWPTAIAKAISSSRIMVLVFSASSNSSQDVGRELILASNSKLVIIPFKIENIEPEPGKQYYLARTHWLDAMNPPTRGQITALVNRVKSILSAIDPDNSIKAEPDQGPQPPLKGSGAWRWPVLIAGGLVMLGLSAWFVRAGRFTHSAALTQKPTPMTSVSTPTNSSPGTATLSSDTLFLADFNDPSFNGGFDASSWSSRVDSTRMSIKQTDGAMVFSTLSTAGSQNNGLVTHQLWPLGEFRYVEARLKLDQERAGANGNVAITLSDLGDWWAGCGIQVGDPTPYYWCGQSAPDPQSAFEYMSDSYYVAYDKWYTARIEFDSQTKEFRGYIDGKLVGSWRPANTTDLAMKRVVVSIGSWTDNSTMITGNVDDVRVVK